MNSGQVQRQLTNLSEGGHLGVNWLKLF